MFLGPRSTIFSISSGKGFKVLYTKSSLLDVVSCTLHVHWNKLANVQWPPVQRSTGTELDHQQDQVTQQVLLKSMEAFPSKRQYC